MFKEMISFKGMFCRIISLFRIFLLLEKFYDNLLNKRGRIRKQERDISGRREMGQRLRLQLILIFRLLTHFTVALLKHSHLD